jgi:16S rRNA (guanine966-N2)-methyltransferase
VGRSGTGRLRVVAGTVGGRRLESPAGAARPTAERVREAVFASIGVAVSGAVVLDLYAGTGAMAIEALSRGASGAVLVERDRREAAVCRRNLVHTGFDGRARVAETDVARFLDRPPAEAPFSLVCCDPPYDTADAAVDGLLARLDTPGWLASSALLVVERPVGSALTAPPGWEHRFARAYGDTLVHLLFTQT